MNRRYNYVDVGQPDEKSIITYVSSLCNAMPKNLPHNNHYPVMYNGLGKEKKGLVQEYSMLYKSLHRWLTDSIKLMDGSSAPLPYDYIDLKSLMADLKSFRLEDYTQRFKDRKKLINIYSELQSVYSKEFAQTIDSEENLNVIDFLWDKLDQTLQNRESQLEQAIFKSERLQKTFDRLNRESKHLSENLNILKQQLDICVTKLKSGNQLAVPKGGVKHQQQQISSTPLIQTKDLNKTLETISLNIHQNEIVLRQYLIDAQKLKEENCPNSDVLIQKLSKLERCTIDLLVQLNSLSTQTNNNNSNGQQQHQTSLTSLTSPTNSSFSISLKQPTTESSFSPPSSIIISTPASFQTPLTSKPHTKANGRRLAARKFTSAHSPPPPSDLFSKSSTPHLSNSISVDCTSSGFSSLHQQSQSQSQSQSQHNPHHRSSLANRLHESVCITTTTTTTTTTAAATSTSTTTAAAAGTHPLSSTSTFATNSSPSSILSSFASGHNQHPTASTTHLLATMPHISHASYVYDARSPIASSTASSTSNCSALSISKQLSDMINDAVRWINNRQNIINSVQYKADIAMIEVELSRVRQVASEVKKFHTNLEHIELLKMEHPESPELNMKVNEIFSLFNNLCKSLNSAQNHLDSLMEFNKLIQDELRYISEMEDIELNRDWSQPKKLNSSDLIQHKMTVEMTLNHKKPRLNTIINFAERLIEARHPASDDLQGYISTLNSETIWLQQLMCLLGIHITELQQFEKFDKDSQEMNVYLNDVQGHLESLASSSLNLPSWSKSTCEEFTTQFNIFKHNFQVRSSPAQQIERLYELVKKMSSYRMRKMNLRSPYENAQILTDYYLVECKFSKGELCKIIDNSNQVKWKVLSLEKNRDAFIPSVCFSLHGPDPDFIEQVDKLKVKYQQINESIDRFETYLRKENLCQLMRGLVKDSQSPNFIQSVNRESLDRLVRNVRDEVDSILSTLKQQQRTSSNNNVNNTEPGLSLLSEFKAFEQHFKQLFSNQSNGDTNGNISMAVESSPTNDIVDQIDVRLRKLYEKFQSVVDFGSPSSLVVIKHLANNRNVFVKRNLDAESRLQQFDQDDCRAFDRDYKDMEKKLVSHHHRHNDEYRDRLEHIRNKYRNLVSMSSLFSRSFSNIDNLTSRFDEFTSVLCNMEEQLECQSIIDITSTSQLREEMDTISGLKSIIKSHENDLDNLKATYTDLKQMIDCVRSCKYDEATAADNGEQPVEDFAKLDHLIDQLTERWNAAINLYSQRRANLKKCLYSYQDYMNTLKNEKSTLSAISAEVNNSTNNEDAGLSVEKFAVVKKTINEKRASIDTCNKEAANYVRMVKALNEQLNSYKHYLNEIDNQKKPEDDKDNSVEEINHQQSSSPSSINDDTTKNNIRLINQSILIQTCNQLNELNKQYFDLCSVVCQNSDSDKNEEENQEDDEIVDFLMVYLNQLDPKPEKKSLNLVEMNYKDFCGSQEFSKLSNSSSTTSAATTTAVSNGLTRSKSAQLKDTTAGEFFFTSSSSAEPLAQLNHHNHQQAQISSHSSSSSSSLLLNDNHATSQQQPSELYNFFSSSLISDYRLTLTDLIELNLIDITNGLIINPLNGTRLSVADAMRIDLLNSDVKEIANTMLFFNGTIDLAINAVPPAEREKRLESYKSLKLSVKEAIQLCVLNPIRNEIVVNVTGQNPIKLNLYEARKRNLILKPLTLSEAFIRNLIQPNGFVRNPINNKYYAFESLTSRSNDSIYLFDLDSKHIIDPNDAERRLLSLAEAIESGLIVPRTFELRLSTNKRSAAVASQLQSINLYEAFFRSSSANLQLSLLLYKPEIENVYVRIMSSSSPESRMNANRVAAILSKRDKIGLVEAVNLNLIDIKRRLYMSDNLCVSLEEAALAFKLIDPSLLDLLNSSVGLRGPNDTNLTILDCIQDSTLQLEKYQFKHPTSNEYLNLDSHMCKSILGDDVVRRIKQLITRINVKSYIICLNKATSEEGSLPPQAQSSCNEVDSKPSSTLIGIKTPPSVVHNKPAAVAKTASIVTTSTGNKKPDLIASCYYFCDDLTATPPSASSPASTAATAFDKLKRQQSKTTNGSVCEAKSYVLDYVLEPTAPFRRLSIIEAKKRGLLNVEKGVYTNKATNTVLTIEEAIELGLIGTRAAGRRVMPVENVENEIPTTTKTAAKRSHESTTLTIESVLDPKTNLFYTVSEAVKMGLIDQASLTYRNTLTGAQLPLNDAFVSGFVKGQLFQNQNRSIEANTKILNDILGSNLNHKQSKTSNDSGIESIESNTSNCVFSQTTDGKNTCLHELVEKSVQIKSLFNPLTQNFVSLDQAIADKLFDKSSGIYTDPVSGRKMTLNELALNGYLKTSAHLGPEKSVLVIDIKKDKEKESVNSYRVNAESKATIEDVLYELKELEQLTQQEIESGKQNESRYGALNELRRKKTTTSVVNDFLKPQIIERRIPSFYGSDQRLTGSETLVIDDVRQSVMLDIDSVTHILKNECTIVDEAAAAAQQAAETQKHKLNNRTVIVVEDQLINTNGVEKLKNNETLKIDVRNNSRKAEKSASVGYLNGSDVMTNGNGTIDRLDQSSNEFLTRSERAQFERVDNKQKKDTYTIYFSPTKSDTTSSHRETLDREKSKMIKSNVVVESNKTDNADKTMSPKSTTTTVSSQRYHVTRVEENVHLTRKYRIKWAVDPSNGRKYSLDEIVQSSLIDKTMRMFFVPSTRQLLDLDEAIRSGIVFAELIDEFIEASNESFEYVEEKKSSSLSTLRFVDVVHKKDNDESDEISDNSNSTATNNNKENEPEKHSNKTDSTNAESAATMAQQQNVKEKEMIARSLYDQLTNELARIGEFEFEMANKQLPLSDQLNTLLAQDRDYSELSLVIMQYLPHCQQVIIKCRDFIDDEQNRRLVINLCDELAQLENQCSNKIHLLTEQVEIRRRKFETAVENLDKFYKESQKYTEQMNQIDSSLIKIESSALENSESVQMLRSNESELKTLEDVLLTRLLDLKYIKTSQQIYSNLCELFSKDLQTYASKTESSASRRLSTDYLSDLTHMRSHVQHAEERFNELMTKKDQLKALIREMLRKQAELDQVNALAANLEAWLDEIEAKIERSNAPAAHKRHQAAVDVVRELEELSDAYRLLRTDIQQQRWSVDELQQRSNAESGSYANRAALVNDRFQRVDKLVADKLNSLIEQLTSARNLKENIDVTNSWLNEIDQVYLANNGEKFVNGNNKHSDVSNGEKDEQLDKLKAELTARKEALVKTLSETSSTATTTSTSSSNSDSSKTMVEQVLNKIESVSKRIEQRTTKAKNLQSLLDQFSTSYEKMSLQCKRMAFKLDNIDVSSGQLIDSTSASAALNSRVPTSESFRRSLQMVDEIRSELRQSEVNLLDCVLRPCLEQLESLEYLGDLLTVERFEALNADLNDLKSDVEQLDAACDQKWALLNEAMKSFVEFADRKNCFDAWLNAFEVKINHFEPVAINLEIVEKQFEQLQQAIDDYEKKSNDLEELNKSMHSYVKNIDTYQNQEPLSQKLKSRGKSRGGENGNGVVGSSTLNRSEIEVEFRKQADLYEWLGARLNERKSELTNALGQMKSYLTELHSADNQLSALESQITSSLSRPLPLSRDALKSLLGESQNAELNRLGADLETIRDRGRPIVQDESKLGAGEVKRQLNSLSDRFVKLTAQNELVRERIDKFGSALDAFDTSYSGLERSMAQKKDLLDVMSIDKVGSDSTATVNADLPIIEVQLKQIELVKDDFNKSDYNLLSHVNQNGELLFGQSRADKDQETLKSQLTKINSDFNLLATQLNSLLEFKQNMHSLSSSFASKSAEFHEALNKIDNEIDTLNRQHPSSVTTSDLNSLELEQIPICEEKLHTCESQAHQIVDLNRSYLVLNGYGDVKLDEELSLKVAQMRSNLESTRANFDTLKSYVNEHRSNDQLYSTLKEFIGLRYSALDDMPVSGELSKLESQRSAHDAFIGDLIEKGDSVKKLMEYFAEIEEVDLGAELQAKWNQLCAKSDARKEKLLVCISMSKQFEAGRKDLEHSVREIDTKFASIINIDSFEQRIVKIKEGLSDLEKEKSSFDKLEKIGEELREACTEDTAKIELQTDEIRSAINGLELKLNASLRLYNEELQKEKAFIHSANEIKNELSDLETRLSSEESSPLISDVHKRAMLRQKLDLCKQLIENESSISSSSDNTKTRTLQELKSLFDRLERLIEAKQEEQIERQNREFENFKKELGNLDDKLKSIQDEIAKGRGSSGEETNGEEIKKKTPVKSALQSLNDQIESANANISKLSSSSSPEHVKQLQHTMNDLIEKYAELSAIQERENERETKMFDALMQAVNECNSNVVKCGAEFEQCFGKQQQQNQVVGANSPSTVITGLIDELKQFERERLVPIRGDLERLDKQYEQAREASMDPEKLAAVELNLDKLNSNVTKLEQKLTDREKALDMVLFKSAKFEDKVKILNENLGEIERGLKSLDSMRFGLANLAEIESALAACETTSKQLSSTSSEIDEFKEICEKIMESCESASERDLVEKRMDNTVLKWSLLNKHSDELRVNLLFLKRHLADLNDEYLSGEKFLASLPLKFIGEFQLNCIDPIVIKHQYERMREINESMIANENLFRVMCSNANDLLSLYDSYESIRKFDELENGGENRYLGLLPKTISSVCVKSLVEMIDQPDVECKVSDVESKYNNYLETLRRNLGLMERLFPLCEKFSSSISQLNQVIAKHESELEWLSESSENETSAKEKEAMYDELKRNVKESEKIMNNLEGALSTSIIDELNSSSGVDSEELIADLNENIERIRLKFGTLNTHLNEYELALESRRLKIKELYAEIDDLLEWLDEVDTRLTQIEPLSHDPDVIKAQLNEQTAINEEIGKQREKLKQLVESSKQLIRQRCIDDSIELKEKLAGLQIQSQALGKQGAVRLNELEQAYAIAKNFSDAHKMLALWFDEIGEQLSGLNARSNGAASVGVEMLKHELNMIKQIERKLGEKKVHLEALNKSGHQLAKICNKNSANMPASQLAYSASYGGSSTMLLSSGASLVEAAKTPEQGIIKDCASSRHLKQLIGYANQRYESYKHQVQDRKDELESLIWRAADFPDKLDSLTNSLNANVESYEYAEPISAHPDKLRLQLDESRQLMRDLEKRKQALEDLKVQITTNPQEVLQQQQNDSKHADPITSPENLERKINELDELWHQLKEVSDIRSKSLEETLETSETFWSDFNGLMEVIGDLEERLRQIESETVAIDPDSVMEQQHYHEQIVRDIDDNEMSVNGFKETGGKLMEMCGQAADQQEVEKTLEELEQAWARIKKLVRDRDKDLQDTFGKACEFQQELIEILEWISLQQEKFVNLDSSFKSSDPTTIRFQIDLLKEFKDQVDPEQVKIQLLNQRFNDLKASTKTNQSFEVLESLQEPLNSANKEWKRLQSSIIERRANLQNALLETGQFNDALDEMLKWLDSTNNSLDQIDLFAITDIALTSNKLISSIDVQLAKLKVIQSDIKAQEQSVQKLCETGKNLIKNETTGKQTLKELKSRVQLLWDSWTQLQAKLASKQAHLNTRLNESQQFECELQDMLVWLSEIESQHLNASKPFGGLPETSKEQLDKFLHVYKQLDANETIVQRLIETGKSLVEKKEGSDTHEQQTLVQSLETLANRWLHVKKKAADRKEKLEQAHADANDFHANLNGFVAWLTETEKNLNMLRPVSRVLDTLTTQIGEHQLLQKNITEHREQMLELDRLGTHLKYFSQKQDVILIKNLLIAAQNRWEKIVWRSAERTRDLERGYKEAKQFYDTWKDLLSWLNSSLAQLNHDQQIGNNPAKIKQMIVKQKEFYRALGQKQATYDATLKTGRKLIDKCEPDQHDRVQLQEMLTELKNKWQQVCFQSVEKQKKLEDALLCSGQFRDALQSLLEWLSKVEPTLAENTSLNGDLESVLALIEDNQQFQLQLQHKADQVNLVRKAANELINGSGQNSSDDDIADLNSQLTTMNSLWERIERMSQDRTVRLESALKLAKEFNAQARSRIEWLNNAELQLKQSSMVSLHGVENQHDILEAIESQQSFVHDLEEQESLMRTCVELGQQLLSDCIPEAVINLKHWLVVLQSRWDDVSRACDDRTRVLNEQLQQCKENELALDELLAWLQGAEATLTALEQKPIAQSIDAVEQLLADHQEFLNDMHSRQPRVEKITKSGATLTDPYAAEIKKKSTSTKTLNKSTGWKTPEPKIRNPRVKLLFDRWRKVWLMAFDRQRKLKEAAERLREMERLKNFNFDDWRRRYMNWHKDNRARITDFFRRQDRDHDGKISREEFIQGILSSNFPSSRLELEAVADIFDLDKDGFIDYKEFLATLKATSSSSGQPNVERIRDEVQRQVSMCKCSKRYHVLQISEKHYRFGDSQKLRLVRILQSTVMVRVGGGWMALDEFLVKNDPCRAKGRTNIELRDPFLSGGPTVNMLTAKSQQQQQPQNRFTKSSNRSNGASSSAANTTFIKHTSPTLNDESSEQLAAPNAGGGTSNSQSGSLGASISDLSSEASEFSDPAASNAAAATAAPLVDVVAAPSSSKHPPLPKKFTSKASVDVPSGASTPTKSSRLPIPKKN